MRRRTLENWTINGSARSPMKVAGCTLATVIGRVAKIAGCILGTVVGRKKKIACCIFWWTPPFVGPNLEDFHFIAKDVAVNVPCFTTPS